MNHRFHDREWVENYAKTVNTRRPERIEMFAHIVEQVRTGVSESPTVVELASGPGLLALSLLEGMETLQYVGVDYSQEMVRAAQNATVTYQARCQFYCVDLREDNWADALPTPVDAIISNMALHDLEELKFVEAVYQKSAQMIKPNGLFLNAELVVEADSETDIDGGKAKVGWHLEALKKAGFEAVDCSLDFGHYACVQGYRS
jgi:trans-aconitate methyltransferase